jgi:cell pole-organizing protein PopZ
MEEILASIRSIIADDKEPVATTTPPVRPIAPAGPQIVYSNDSVPAARVAAPEPAPVAPSLEPPAGDIASAAPKVVWERSSPAAAPTPVAPEQPVAEEAPAAEEPVVSPETDAAVAASFQALSTTIAMQSSEMIEGLTREMLRPMLKSWLDDNLPSLVERLVRAEIQRVARGGR